MKKTGITSLRTLREKKKQLREIDRRRGRPRLYRTLVAVLSRRAAELAENAEKISV